MKIHRLFYMQAVCRPALLFITMFSVLGCSASNDVNSTQSVADDTQSSMELADSELDNNVSNANPDVLVADPDTEFDTDVLNDDGVLNNETVVVDPLVQNTILVTFEVTVPFYLSNKLRVALTWGDIYLTAKWVGGQFWSASGEFPTQTEHPLTITFYDNNGAIELARYNQDYATTSNLSEPVLIQAEQFDASSFDDDGDGVNNLDELNAGSDPFVDEDSLLEIKDFYALSNEFTTFSRLSVSESFESRLSDNRPYVGTFDRDPDWGVWGELVLADPSVDGEINIDADGNGTLSMQAGRTNSRPQLRLNGTRARSENSISWTAVRQAWSSDYYHEDNVTNTVSIVDDTVRNFVEVVTGSNTGAKEFAWQADTNLTGNLIQGSSLCKPVAGTAAITQWTTTVRGRFASIVTINVSKESDDLYWRVVEVDDDLENNTFETTEFFVRELRIKQRADAPETANFICEFVEL